MADGDGDDYKLTLAQQIFGKTVAILGRHPPDSDTKDLSDAKAGRQRPSGTFRSAQLRRRPPRIWRPAKVKHRTSNARRRRSLPG